MKIDVEKGWTEVIIDDDCEYNKFYEAADILHVGFDLIFTNKIDDYNSIYWNFEYKRSKLVLCYNIYLGISIYPNAFKEATAIDNENVVEISKLLFCKLTDFNWHKYDDGKTVGEKGSESGIIVNDIEHVKGARISIEKDCGDIPFAVTLGIYGTMLHTHFESELDKANDYVTDSKYKINKILDLFDKSEEQRDALWQSKYNKLVNELAEMPELMINRSLESKGANFYLNSLKGWWNKYITSIK